MTDGSTSTYVSWTVVALQAECRKRKINFSKRERKQQLVDKLDIFDETAHLPRNWSEPDPVKHKEGSTIPPQASEEDAMGQKPNPIGSDADSERAKESEAKGATQTPKTSEEVRPEGLNTPIIGVLERFKRSEISSEKAINTLREIAKIAATAAAVAALKDLLKRLIDAYSVKPSSLQSFELEVMQIAGTYPADTPKVEPPALPPEKEPIMPSDPVNTIKPDAGTPPAPNEGTANEVIRDLNRQLEQERSARNTAEENQRVTENARRDAEQRAANAVLPPPTHVGMGDGAPRRRQNQPVQDNRSSGGRMAAIVAVVGLVALAIVAIVALWWEHDDGNNKGGSNVTNVGAGIPGQNNPGANPNNGGSGNGAAPTKAAPANTGSGSGAQVGAASSGATTSSTKSSLTAMSSACPTDADMQAAFGFDRMSPPIKPVSSGAGISWEGCKWQLQWVGPGTMPLKMLAGWEFTATMADDSVVVWYGDNNARDIKGSTIRHLGTYNTPGNSWVADGCTLLKKEAEFGHDPQRGKTYDTLSGNVCTNGVSQPIPSDSTTAGSSTTTGANTCPSTPDGAAKLLSGGKGTWTDLGSDSGTHKWGFKATDFVTLTWPGFGSFDHWKAGNGVKTNIEGAQDGTFNCS